MVTEDVIINFSLVSKRLEDDVKLFPGLLLKNKILKCFGSQFCIIEKTFSHETVSSKHCFLKKMIYLMIFIKCYEKLASWRLVAFKPVAVKVLVVMCTQLTNRTINVRTRIEKVKIVVLFDLSGFFICFSSNLMKNVTKKV